MTDDIEELSHYVAVLNYGIGKLDTQSPISARLLHNIHKILLRGKRGTSKSLGEFRKAQN
ncbi:MULTISPECIES: hypothetical protein [unclassified Bartonella]|uniref:hypothetical protein n=1 Tax=unclassified Bartonella TaxID=2645622 RepID=UPI0035CF1C66